MYVWLIILTSVLYDVLSGYEWLSFWACCPFHVFFFFVSSSCLFVLIYSCRSNAQVFVVTFKHSIPVFYGIPLVVLRPNCLILTCEAQVLVKYIDWGEPAKKNTAHDDVTHDAMARKILMNIIDLATRIELTLNFNATTLKRAEKFDHPFSHLFIFHNIFAQGHGFNAMTMVEWQQVASSENEYSQWRHR